MYLIINNKGKVLYRTDILSLALNKWNLYNSKKEDFKGYKFVQVIEENIDVQNIGIILNLGVNE